MNNSFSGDDACKLLKSGAVLVDVRSPAEYNNGCLPDAINLPLQQITNAPDIFDAGKDLILYCVTGARSSSAKNYLNQLGFENVYDLGSFRNYNCE